MELDHQIQDTLSSLKSSLEKTSTILSVLTPPSLEEAEETLTDPEARARFHATIAFALNALYFIYVRCSGQIPHDHLINSEIHRVKRYFEKITKRFGPESEQESPRETQAPFKVDQDAADRFVRHALGVKLDLDAKSAEQRRDANAAQGRSHQRFTTSNARSTVAPRTNNALWQQLKAQSASTEEMVDKFLQKKRAKLQ